jgi:hypothetical protein
VLIVAKKNSTDKGGESATNEQQGAQTVPPASDAGADDAAQGAATETVVNEPQTAADAAGREGAEHGSAPSPDGARPDAVGPDEPVQRQGQPGVPLPSPTLRRGDVQTPLRPDALAPGDPGETPKRPPHKPIEVKGEPLKYMAQDDLRSRAMSLRAELAKAAAEDQRSMEVQWGRESEDPTIAVQILPRVRSGEQLAGIIQDVAAKSGLSLRERRQIGRTELLVFNVHAA